MESGAIEIRDLKERVLKVLRQWGPTSYSKLLVTTAIPEEYLRKVLRRLVDDKAVEEIDGDEPVYEEKTSAFLKLFGSTKHRVQAR